jgi:hypothetical protein
METEAQYLERQAAEAQAAIGRTLSEAPAALRGAANVPAWARRYPWWTVGAVAVAGFAAVAIVRGRPTASRESSGASRSGESPAVVASAATSAPTMDRASRRSAFLSAVGTALGGLLLEALRGIVRNALAGAFSPQSTDRSAQTRSRSD